jgi:hypothetical protein
MATKENEMNIERENPSVLAGDSDEQCGPWASYISLKF